MNALPPSYRYEAVTRRLALDPRDQAFVQDPYAAYAALHDASGADGPVVFWQDYDHWVFGGSLAVNALLRERRLGRQILHVMDRKTLGWPAPAPHLADFDRVDAHSLLELEPPDHTRLRGLVNRAFLSRAIEALGPSIAQEAEDAMRSFGEEADLITGFAQPIAARTIARMLGIDDGHVPDLLRWSHSMVQMYAFGRNRAAEDAANAAARAFACFLRGEIKARRARPGDDLLSRLIAAQEAEDRLSDAEIISTSILLLNAGHEASVHAMGHGVWQLLQADPDQRALWLTTPDRLVEEVLRHRPPLHMFTRYVLEDCTLYGVPLCKGQVTGLHLGMANHDPRVCTNPQRFDPARAPIKNVAFGAGLHFCIGHGLARLELARSLPLLFARFPKLALTEPPRLKDAYHFHGLERLQVRLS